MNISIGVMMAVIAITSAQFPLLGQKQLSLDPFKVFSTQQTTGGTAKFGVGNQIAGGSVKFGAGNQIAGGSVKFGAANFGGSINVNPFSTNFRKVPSLVEVIEQEWADFKKNYNKVYTDIEETLRKEIFIENRQAIIDFNSQISFGGVTFTQQINEFADMLPREFSQRLNGFNQSNQAKRVKLPTPTTFIPSANVNVPERMDWRDFGAVTSVKTQGDCMGCYAFTAAAALETHTFRKTGKLVDLSAQQIIDCSKAYSNDGCKGGLMDDAYEYIKNQPGLDTWDSYPYEGQDGECRFKPEAVGAYCTGYVSIPEGDEKAMEIAVATIGPISVAIDASQRGFQFYRDGIYFDPNCKKNQTEMNHGVLIIGYGAEPDGRKYWLVKNSYGPGWGNGGYVKMAKEAGNHCGIANLASYPLV